MSKQILVIPDSHECLGHGTTRWSALLNWIGENQPEIIVHIGDLFDMPSLCQYDKGTQDAEGRRYTEDLKAGLTVLELFNNGLKEINKGRKYKIYEPRKVFTIGNHEHRISRASQEAPELYGFLSLKDLRLEEYGWEVYDFLKPVEIEGIAFAHYFISGVMGRPISGQYPAAAFIRKHFRSGVFGHSHVFDYCERHDTFGKPIQAVNCGVFLEPNYWAKYAGQANLIWRNGFLVLNHVKGDGSFDLQWISTDSLLEKYYDE